MFENVYIVMAIDPSWQDATPRPVYAFLEEDAAHTHAKKANAVAMSYAGRYNHEYENEFDPAGKGKVWRAPYYEVESVVIKGP